MKAETLEVIKLVEEMRDCDNDIFELQQQKARAERRLDELVLSRNGTPLRLIGENNKVQRGRTVSETSAKRLIANLINAHPDAEFDGTTVSETLGINLGTVRTNLSRLASRGEIEKRSFGTYGAKTQEKEAPEEAS